MLKRIMDKISKIFKKSDSIVNDPRREVLRHLLKCGIYSGQIRRVK